MRLIAMLPVALACASDPSETLPLRPALYVRDDSSQPDKIQARRDYARCQAEGIRADADIFPLFGPPFPGQSSRYWRAYNLCMQAAGWILLPERREAAEPLVGLPLREVCGEDAERNKCDP